MFEIKGGLKNTRSKSKPRSKPRSKSKPRSRSISSSRTRPRSKSELDLETNSILLKILKEKKISEEYYPCVTSESINFSKTKFTPKDLEFIIKNFNISLRKIVRTQTITEELYNKYFLEDDDITNEYILYHQPNLKFIQKI